MISHIDHHNKDNRQGKVSHGLVEYEDKDGFAADLRLVDGGDGGYDHHQVQ